MNKLPHQSKMFKLPSRIFANSQRFFSNLRPNPTQGLVVGVSYDNANQPKLTPFGTKFDQMTGGKILSQIQLADKIGKGKSRICWGITGPFPAVAVAGISTNDDDSDDGIECMNTRKESIRVAAAVGAKALLKENITNIFLEDFMCPQSAAEGATLGVYKYQAQKSLEKRKPVPNLRLVDSENDVRKWVKGYILGNTQNWVRNLMETPPNFMTPILFADHVRNRLGSLGVDVIAHGAQWAQQQGMNAFLSVAKGSVQPPIFLEITYNGAGNAQPICLVGKGITFDSGGLSIKPNLNMDSMRADMGGAAVVSGVISALAELQVPVNVKGLIPLTENMPSGSASKPGDVVFAMNGKSICIDNTDCEGRLILCDALCYATLFDPRYIVDVATLTGAVKAALGNCCAGVFVNNYKIWPILEKASFEAGDRLWRLPLFKHYSKDVTKDAGHDLNNLGELKLAGPCTAAAFLREFVPKHIPWIHIDNYGVMEDCEEVYLKKGMSGRPMRTIFEFICLEAGITDFGC